MQSSSSGDLLDLVRAAEDEVMAGDDVANSDEGEPDYEDDEDEYVDVGSEAVDAPPSRPGLPDASAAHGARSMSPALGILLILAVAVCALALLAR